MGVRTLYKFTCELCRDEHTTNGAKDPPPGWILVSTPSIMEDRLNHNHVICDSCLARINSAQKAIVKSASTETERVA